MGAQTKIDLPGAAVRGRWGRLLSADDAAEYLGISVTTLRELDIASKGIGRRKLYDIRDLDRFVDRMANEDAPKPAGGAAAEDIAAEEAAFFERRKRKHG